MATRGGGFFNRLDHPAARKRAARHAWLAALAFAAQLLIGPAQAGDPTTAALPPAAFAGRTAELPAVLSPDDVAVYRRIFDLQEDGEWRAADSQIKRLKDRILLGHVLGQRYLHPRYRTPAAELTAWLSKYADHPDAPRLYKLAGKRVPKTTRVRRPVGDSVGGLWALDDLGPPPERPPPPGRKLSGEARNRANALMRQIGRNLRAGRLTNAEQLLGTRDGARLLSDGEEDHFRARIAAGWFALGDDDKAFELAGPAAARSGKVVPRANWIAGLSLFKQERYGEAARHFEALATIPDGEPWDIASGAFWAARAHARDRRFDRVNPWLDRAAKHPRTFYGLLAIRQLGIPMPFNWDPPPVTASDLEAVRRTPAGSRAFALIQVDQSHRAEAELRRVLADADPSQLRTLLAIAMRSNLPGLSIRLGGEISELDGRRNDGAIYPIPPWAPSDGFKVDRALLFAIMRQESQFNPRAKSHAGARGLMQLMPRTAAQLDGRAFRGRAALVRDPEYNLTLGQRYIVQLLENEAVQGDLIRLAAAYNGGPGNLARWTRKQDMRGGEDDALLFIESLPSPETRHFIERILYSYWMYSERLGQPTPSLDEVAAGRWPTYIALDTGAKGSRLNAQTR